ncbi:META domain-containing protein [Streptomyces sp. NPDC005209]|uniref:META domain-containing protein n=1 Tax=Streptomyces sp. NPDC005209 TaxID=3156715 RepID=UPI0033B24000
MYRHTQRMVLTAAAALVPLVAACGARTGGSETVGGGSAGSGSAGGGSAAARQQVTGVGWTVDSLTVDGVTQRAPAGARLEIDDRGRAQGNYGCNLFGARASFDGDRVRLSDTSATEMACASRPMAFEHTLAQALAGGTLTTAVKGDKLTLTTATGDRVRLSKEEDAPLYGTEWIVTTPRAKGRAHLTFDKRTGKVTGSLGCNHVTADATVRDARITLGRAATTRMVCDASLMHAEKSLLRLFNGVVGYRLDSRTLTLTSKNGERVAAVAAG